MFFSIYQIQRERERERKSERAITLSLVDCVNLLLPCTNYSLITGALRGAYKASE